MFCRNAVTRSWQHRGNHLSQSKNSPLESLQFVIQSSPTVVWVYRLRGLPRSTSTVSNPASSLWHFSGILGHSLRLSRFSRRHRVHSVPRLIFSASTNTTGIAACASMDLPNTTIAVLNHPRLASKYYKLLPRTKASVNLRYCYFPHRVGSQRPAVPGWISVWGYPYW